MYGRGRGNVVSPGDWLIDQFPISRPIEDSLLSIDEDILKELLVDREAVSIYKARVHDNVAKVGAQLAAMLRNVAVAS